MNVYVDTCVLIYRVEGTQPLMTAARACLSRLGPRDLACISPLVRLECLVKPLRTADPGLRSVYETTLGALHLLELGVPVFDLAAELRAVHAMKTPDAIHAACALHHGCDEIWTGDERFTVLESRIGIRLVK